MTVGLGEINHGCEFDQKRNEKEKIRLIADYVTKLNKAILTTNKLKRKKNVCTSATYLEDVKKK